jgi:hypothetical protein
LGGRSLFGGGVTCCSPVDVLVEARITGGCADGGLHSLASSSRRASISFL